VILVLVLGEPVTWPLILAGLLMADGVWLHLTERHEHEHTHAAVTHDRWHIHDEHHQYAHDEPIAAGTRHRHVHAHEPITHTHEHYPDSHHHHEHGEAASTPWSTRTGRVRPGQIFSRHGNRVHRILAMDDPPSHMPSPLHALTASAVLIRGEGLHG
jgi:hypothetical protein